MRGKAQELNSLQTSDAHLRYLEQYDVLKLSVAVISLKMEDPNLLEESSALMEASEGGRGAPLRLGLVPSLLLI